MKIAIVTDSNSGITQAQAGELGIFVLPMPFMINGETFEEDINLTQEEFYKRQAEDADISTSQPSPQDVTDLWDKLLAEGYHQIVHIPMSSGLSGSCQTARMLADDYEGKVFVVNNQRISVTQRQSVLDAKELAEAGLIQGEKLDSFSKVRTMKQARAAMLSAAEKDLRERFADPEAENTWLFVAHTQNDEMAAEFAKEIGEHYPKAGTVYGEPLSLSIACHIGPGSLAIAMSKKIDIEAERKRYGL